MKYLLLLLALAIQCLAQITFYPANADAVTAGTTNRFAPDIYRVGLLAEYRFDSSTIITDYSGSGNTGAVVGSPTIANGGVSGFDGSDYITTPVTGAKTISFLADFSQVPGMAVGKWGTLYGSSVNTNIHLFARDGDPGSNQNSRLSIYSGGLRTQSTDSTYGIHHVTYVLDGTADRLYIDGIEAQLYKVQGASGSIGQGSQQIGASTAFSLYFPGTIYHFAAWSGELTAAQIYQNAKAVMAQKAATGVVIPSQLSTSLTNILHCFGDSLTFGQTTGGGVTSGGYPALLSLTDTFTVLNEGLSGNGAEYGSNALWGQVYPQFAPNAQRNVVVYWLGTNDMAGGNSTTDVSKWVVAGVRGLVKQGFQVFVLPMISRAGSVNGQTNDYWAGQLNTSLSSAAANAGYTYVTLSTSLTNAGSYSSSTYYQTDGIHLKAAGYQLVATAVQAAINGAH